MIFNRGLIFLFFLTLLPLNSNKAFADALAMSEAMNASTIAQYHIDEKGVLVELEIGMDSIQVFKNILPDAIYQDLGYGDEPLAERFKTFYSSQFYVADSNGDPIAGNLLSIEPGERIKRDPITGEPLKTDKEIVVINANLYFPFNPGEPLPEQVSIGLIGEVASVGFVVYHNKVAVNEFRYLTGALTVELDWVDSWYSEFTNSSLRRTYYSAMNGFLYVEPYEIRKEIIVRPKDLQHWTDLGLEGKDVITKEMFDDVLEGVKTFLDKHLPVEVDGQPAKLTLDRINFIERTLTSSRVIQPPEDLDVNSAIIGAIYVQPTSGLPDKVVMTWDLFNEKIQQISASATDELGPLPIILEPDFNVLEWQNFIKNPTIPTLVDLTPPADIKQLAAKYGWPVLAFIALVMLIRAGSQGKFGAGQLVPVVIIASLSGGGFWYHQQQALDQEKLNGLFNGLLANIYHAFDFHDEGLIYDTLEHSIDGNLLTTVYLEMKKGLVLANQGGAQAKVKNVEINEVKVNNQSDEQISAQVTWTVSGSVGHWGHIHERINKYQADLSINAINQQWKLTDLNVTLEERL